MFLWLEIFLLPELLAWGRWGWPSPCPWEWGYPCRRVRRSEGDWKTFIPCNCVRIVRKTITNLFLFHEIKLTWHKKRRLHMAQLFSVNILSENKNWPDVEQHLHYQTADRWFCRSGSWSTSPDVCCWCACATSSWTRTERHSSAIHNWKLISAN